ncbi:MAG: hypothetical protein ACRDO8_11930 [Nocardioidaceae bacterium]
MKPERFLGADPAPGDLQSIDDVTAVLRSCVVALAEGRQRLDHLTGPRSAWQGTHASAVVRTLSDFSWELRVLEDAVAEFTQAWQDWRLGVAQRQDRSAELVDVISQIDAGETGQRDVVLERAAALGEEHQRAARETGAAAEALVTAMPADEDDLAGDLSRGLAALHAAVEEWVADTSRLLLRTTDSVDAVAELTAVVPALIGVGAGGPIGSPRVWEMAVSAPGSHRLQDALDTPPEPVDPSRLARATFGSEEQAASSLAERLRGGDT